MAHKDFNRPDPSDDEVGFHTFSVNGEQFAAYRIVPGAYMLELAKVAKAPVEQQAVAAMTFLDQVLEPDSAERFAERMRDPVKPIDIEQAMEVAQWLLADVYTKRPTTPSSRSRQSRSNTGQSSTDGSLSPVSTP